MNSEMFKMRHDADPCALRLSTTLGEAPAITDSGCGEQRLGQLPFRTGHRSGADAEGAAADSLAKRCGWAEAASAANQPVPAIFSAALAYPQSYHAMYPLDCAQAQAQRVRCCASGAEMLARIFLALPLTGPQLRREAVCALYP